VAQSADSVVVSPRADTISPGDTLRLVANAFDENGHVVQDAEFDWSSSDASVLRVVASGTVTGLAYGRATVTVVAGDARGTSEITVENLDRAVLVRLYNATDGPNWVNSENWLTDAPLGEWYGVDTGDYERVVRLTLPGRWDSDIGRWVSHGLFGAIPPELANLTNLKVLDVRANNLTGPIPVELGSLRNLGRLMLDNNNLTGTIPTELGNLPSLQHLWLNWNNLTGTIPPELGNLPSLTDLWLNGNSLTGAIPPEIGNLASLGSLVLDNNNFAGTIPTELGNLAGLRYLNLDNNNLTGMIPAALGNLASLRYLYLANNNLTGAIPVELVDLSNLERLRLNNNGLTGTIPAALGNLSKLGQLRLGSNSLTGAIPTSFLGLSLYDFVWDRNTGLCAPDTTVFRAWLNSIEYHVPGPFCAGSGSATESALPLALRDLGSGSLESGRLTSNRLLPKPRFSTNPSELR